LETVLEKFELEYDINSSPKFLFYFLYTPIGLSEWFCDDISIDNDIYTFSWDSEQRKAKLVSSKLNKHSQFRWLDFPEDTFFEFRLETSDVTKGITLFITDFEPKEEIDNSKLLWDAQITKLLQRLGA
jgi:hypothetical protein